jgi:hypothetical protein
MKQKLIDFYNARIIARWYRSASLIGGWVTSSIVFLPDLLQFLADHWELVGHFLLPTFDPETKALILAVYVTFIAPPLRAWAQNAMREAALKQAVKTGAVTSLPFTTEVKVNVKGRE